MPNLRVDHDYYYQETAKLLVLQAFPPTLPSNYRRLVAEIVLLRCFYLLENTIESIASKLPCGAAYLDGSAPQLLVTARSSADAITKMRTLGRRNNLSYLKWTTVKGIKRNIKNVIDGNDNLVRVVDNNTLFIEELRKVRNRIAHNNSKARREFQQIVQRHYGARLNSITPGTLLLLSTRMRPSLIYQYLLGSRILVDQLVKK